MSITDNVSLMRLLTKIHEDKGLDFTQYKESTLLRRINSRLHKYELSSFDDYIKVLEESPDEYNELINALTINVTEFFRNPESFEAIKETIIPRVILSKHKKQHKIIRAWSCGCSSGDEPYSLAILFSERLGNAKGRFLLTIIGSDIDKNALKEAEAMTYSRERVKAIDNKLLQKYFEKNESDNFKLKNSVRSLVRLRRHDVIKDIPFMRCDVILCRNLLIYFNKELQEEILLKFYQCLNPGGSLILGMVESLIGPSINIFEHVNNRLRIYRRPEQDFGCGENDIISQKEIDKIVNEMLDN
ncbi:protein-glutamate O-methyltransferase CheR [Patescibacteria group bacterium]|nr:protein-glutamate O-methyltransferase CheR [Patescibacteria group bacterium]